jgi:hypothetical protein
MNAPAHTEVVIGTDRGQKHFRQPNPDTVPERASFNDPMQPRGTVRPYVYDSRTFETFIGGARI